MAEKINMTELSRKGRSVYILDDREMQNAERVEQWLYTALLCLIADRTAKEGPHAFGLQARNRDIDPDIVLDVDLRINGIEVPLSKWIERLVLSFDQAVEERIKSLTDDRTREAFRKLDDAVEDLADKADDIGRQLAKNLLGKKDDS